MSLARALAVTAVNYLSRKYQIEPEVLATDPIREESDAYMKRRQTQLKTMRDTRMILESMKPIGVNLEPVGLHVMVLTEKNEILLAHRKSPETDGYNNPTYFRVGTDQKIENVTHMGYK